MIESIQNGSETKVCPRTNIAVEKALQVLKERNDNIGSATILTPQTEQRLNAIAPAFMQQVASVARATSRPPTSPAYCSSTARDNIV